ncbi:hypothetical protein [Metabacillus hrfriensis]|uniref:Uncharacterized protein n=1 Tax=Metabacillus hrfriensis TaxID=3048891 RepID=A0ACD4RHY2_9BACI|nr:hypothetical protein [Metabacillus sp. CT-WN-B3]WHZ60086.1 hypothetical protein QLQ22_12455 [Metabacillus sp. CT-WN-B3]
MVYKDIERFHAEKRRKKEVKMEHLRNQLIECFFNIYPPDSIKSKIKASLNESSLPTFICNYKLSSSSDNLAPEEYIKVVTDNEGVYLSVDFDFHNIKRELSSSDLVENFTQYKKIRKRLGSDFQFNVEGRTEEGTIEIVFCKNYKPFISRFFN